MRRAIGLAVILMGIGAGWPVAAAQGPASSDAVLAEALQFFDALDYEGAVPALDRAIATLEPRAAEPGPDRDALARAYELRGRARFGLNDAEGAAADFRSLLQLRPAFAFDAQVSPRVVALLDTVRQTTVGALRLVVEPADALVTLNGLPVPAATEPIPLAAGELTLHVERVGYRPLDQTVTVAANATTELPVALERTSAVVFLSTSPSGAEVLVNGVSRGRTNAAPLVITDLAPGTYAVTFQAECRVSEERQLVVRELTDYRIAPVPLRAAVATLSVSSTPSGASVFLDGEARGTTPVTLPGVCEGSRTVVLRGEHGRYSTTVDVRTGADVSVEGALRPAFALLPAGEPPGPGLPDPRERIVGALDGARHVSVYLPSGAEIEAAMDGQPLSHDWLAFDASRRPIGGAAAMSVDVRRELARRLARGLQAQGVATVVQPSTASSELVVAFMAAGAGQPDVVALLPDRGDSMQRALERFDYVPQLFRRSIDARLLEVLGGQGAQVVVAETPPDGAAAQAGVRAGERIIRAGGREIRSAADLEAALTEGEEDQIGLELADPSGQTRTVSVPVTRSPRLVSVRDQSLLFNPLAAVLRSRLAAADPAEAPFLRLNLAVALLRIGDHEGARAALDGLELPSGPGISAGTRLYLLGLAHEAAGDTLAAEQAWRAAAESGASLTEDGPPIEDLVSAAPSQ